MGISPFPGTVSGKVLIYGVASCAALALNAWFSCSGSRRVLEHQINATAMSQVDVAARSVDGFASRIGVLVGSIAARQRAIGREPRPDTIPFLAQVLIAVPQQDVFNVYMAFEDKKFGEKDAIQAVNRDTWPAPVRHFGYDHHDPNQEWYTGAKQAGRLYVTRPYFDEGGCNVTMVSLTMPVYDESKRLIGVAGADITLDQIRTIVRRIRLGGEAGSAAGEYAYLVSRAGRIVVHPSTGLMLRRGFAGEDLRTLPEGEDVGASPAGFARHRIGSEMRRVYWATAPITGAKVVLNVSEQKVLAPIVGLTVRAVSADLLVLGVMLVLIWLIARRVTQPISEVTRAVEAVASGNFDPSQVGTVATRPDEIGELARGFRRMAGEIVAREQRLADWNANLTLTVAERTAELAGALDVAQQTQARLEEELAEAAAYVMSLLPARLEGPVRSEWVFIPSRLLGGDTFGYHWLDGHRLALYLLDVCGHGVGAALLSISVTNVLRSQSLPDTDFGDPGAVLTALNQRFPAAEQNEMDFTVWYGVYDHARRQLAYASGGHPPAVLVVPGEGRARADELCTPNFMIGMIPGTRYEAQACAVPAGSRLFVFSDGVYEVCSPSGAWLDFDQFVQMLVGRSAPHATGLDGVLADVRAWQQREIFEDDCSIVTFEFPPRASVASADKPPDSGYPQAAMDTDTIRLSIGNALGEVSTVIDVLHDELSRRRLPPPLIHVAQTVADELLSNVIRHGYRDDRPHTIDIAIAVREDGLTLQVSDDGIPFDPCGRPAPDVTRPFEDRPVGGLGIHLVRELAADCRYARVDGRNQVTVTLREPAP
jgi:serine phosphatase RsbU (regulator of sigma subunit)/anti-sigma regulatory factor (Ser/Thr protein kinase)